MQEKSKVGALSFLKKIEARMSGNLELQDQIEEQIDLIQSERLSDTVGLCRSLASTLDECGFHSLAERLKKITQSLYNADKDLKDILRAAKSLS